MLTSECRIIWQDTGLWLLIFARWKSFVRKSAGSLPWILASRPVNARAWSLEVFSRCRRVIWVWKPPRWWGPMQCFACSGVRWACWEIHSLLVCLANGAAPAARFSSFFAQSFVNAKWTFVPYDLKVILLLQCIFTDRPSSTMSEMSCLYKDTIGLLFFSDSLGSGEEKPTFGDVFGFSVCAFYVVTVLIGVALWFFWSRVVRVLLMARTFHLSACLS